MSAACHSLEHDANWQWKRENSRWQAKEMDFQRHGIHCEEDHDEENSDIPFCLFLTLAKLFNRAPSTGANG